MKQSDKLPTIPEHSESTENILEHSTDTNQPLSKSELKNNER